MGIDSFTEGGFIRGGIPRFSEAPQDFVENLGFPALQLVVGLDLLHEQARFHHKKNERSATNGGFRETAPKIRDRPGRERKQKAQKLQPKLPICLIPLFPFPLSGGRGEETGR
jgi:hypothetical protein